MVSPGRRSRCERAFAGRSGDEDHKQKASTLAADEALRTDSHRRNTLEHSGELYPMKSELDKARRGRTPSPDRGTSTRDPLARVKSFARAQPGRALRGVARLAQQVGPRSIQPSAGSLSNASAGYSTNIRSSTVTAATSNSRKPVAYSF